MPDLIISSRKENHCVVWESKSGRSIDNDQAKRLASIKARAFPDQLMLNVKIEDGFAFDIAYACDGKQCQNIRWDLDRVAQELASVGAFPLVGFYDESGIKTHSGRFNKENINRVLGDGINIDLREVPTEYLRFDKDSPLSEIAPYVIANIVAYATRQEPRFSAEQIAKDSYGSSWDYIASNTIKNQVAQKIDNILLDARQNELYGYLTKPGRDGIRSPKWNLSYLNQRGTAFPSRRLKKLQKQCIEFVNRLTNEEAGIYTRQLRLPFFLEEE
ncbi:hypothetical protein KAU87_01620 [Candidatus Bathyarchaeota archaeon]|nr:hypothetical protein [Candidatus Bathyarchaeota archaeon]